MKVILTTLQEIYGLFVEDGSYAAAILIWVAAAAFLLPRLPGGTAWRGPLLFVGLVLLMLENVIRSARNKR